MRACANLQWKTAPTTDNDRVVVSIKLSTTLFEMNHCHLKVIIWKILDLDIATCHYGGYQPGYSLHVIGHNRIISSFQSLDASHFDVLLPKNLDLCSHGLQKFY